MVLHTEFATPPQPVKLLNEGDRFHHLTSTNLSLDVVILMKLLEQIFLLTVQSCSSRSSKLYSRFLWSLGPAGSYTDRRWSRRSAWAHGQQSRSTSEAVCPESPAPQCPRLPATHGHVVECSGPASSAHRGSSGRTFPATHTQCYNKV